MNILAVLAGLVFISWDIFDANFMGWKSATVAGDVFMYGGLVADAMLIFGGLMQPMYVGYALILYGVFRVIRTITDFSSGPPTAKDSKVTGVSKTSLDGMYYGTRTISLLFGLGMLYWGYSIVSQPVGLMGASRRRKH